jgi:hypothetical protein
MGLTLVGRRAWGQLTAVRDARSVRVGVAAQAVKRIKETAQLRDISRNRPLFWNLFGRRVWKGWEAMMEGLERTAMRVRRRGHLHLVLGGLAVVVTAQIVGLLVLI